MGTENITVKCPVCEKKYLPSSLQRHIGAMARSERKDAPRPHFKWREREEKKKQIIKLLKL